MTIIFIVLNAIISLFSNLLMGIKFVLESLIKGVIALISVIINLFKSLFIKGDKGGVNDKK